MLFWKFKTIRSSKHLFNAPKYVQFSRDTEQKYVAKANPVGRDKRL